MRRTLSIAVPVLVAVLGGPAHAELWCIRDAGATARTCAFPSARDCVRAAAIGGGICEREPVVRNDDRPRRPGRNGTASR